MSVEILSTILTVGLVCVWQSGWLDAVM